MRLIDCFTFFNELDVLELRLSELDAVVERFVIAESPLTFTEQEKPLHFALNSARFSRWAHKIEHVVVEDMPVGPGTTPWDREWHQRRALARGYRGGAPDDLVIISDVDEIPRPDVLARLKADPQTGQCLTVLESDASFFFVNCKPVWRYLSHVQAPRMTSLRHAGNPQAMRAFRPRISKHPLAQSFQPALARLRALFTFGAPLAVRIEPQASWHFTYLGGIEAVRSKLSSYSHTEVATAENLDPAAIARAIDERKLIVGGAALEDVPLDESFPATILANPDKWANLIAPTRA